MLVLLALVVLLLLPLAAGCVYAHASFSPQFRVIFRAVDDDQSGSIELEELEFWLSSDTSLSKVSQIYIDMFPM